MTEADFSEANLHSANLTEANLNRVNLRKAILIEANLTKTNLTEADFSEANLHSANLIGVDLNRVDLSKAANIDEVKFVKSLEFHKRLQNSFLLIPVFYATDRQKTGNRSPNRFFNGLPGQLCFGITEVSIPKNHKFGEIERPWTVSGLELSENQNKHMVLVNLQELNESEFKQSLHEKLANSSKRDVLVFIHGYNTSFKDAAYRTGQIAFDLNFQGIPILYSWPSEAKTLKYLVDGNNVSLTVPNFLHFLKLLLESVGANTVHIIAHSMGNRLLIDALNSFNNEELAQGSASLRQIIFAAPDIDARRFSTIANNFRNKAERFTLYASSNDKALQISKALHGFPRAGDSFPKPIVVQDIDSIDVSEIDTNFFSLGHSYFGDHPAILSDIFYLLNQGLSPENRARLIPQTPKTSDRYWFFMP